MTPADAEARLTHHAVRAAYSTAEFEAFERGVPEVDAAYPEYAQIRRAVCLRMRKAKGALK